jgi:uncharacterized UBP type Zn finger protein
MRKCIYCNTEINDDRSMQICDRCGVGVWGKKQWENIKKTTDEARDKGDLNFNSPENNSFNQKKIYA